MTKNVEITKNWNTTKCTKVTVIGTLTLEKEVWLDGDTDTVDCCDMSVNVIVDGAGSQGDWVKELNAAQLTQVPAGFTHIVGKLVLTPEQVEIIKSVESELEKHPAWIKKQALIKANDAAEAKLYAERNASSGWCNKCHSYCWGDCSAN